jgi:asparagine synthase (glutamine-hydrolysing)
MCGIAGRLVLSGPARVTEASIRAMIDALRHRGPEGSGLHVEAGLGLGHARLSIIDVDGGAQPIANEDGSIWAVCNGEVFNYVELRQDLVRRGHRFTTASDSEVLVHLYEERGAQCVEPLIGDFAFAIWDGRARRLLLARDRLGVRPLFISSAVPGELLFASEIKALLTEPRLPRTLDLLALDQVFTYWSPLPGRTMFEGIAELPPGHVLIAEQGRTTLKRYWSLSFAPDASGLRSDANYREELQALLLDATRLRLRADVPVGAYLSGGLDSSTITALARRSSNEAIETFSVAFADAAYDEREYQTLMATALGTRHHVLEVTDGDIADAFPDVVWHAESALLRTAPAPLFLLSRFVQESGLKAVLTGEGADEFLGGYDIFREAKIRRFWARRPDSRLRPRLFERVNGFVEHLQATPGAYRRVFYGQGLAEVENPAYSHLVRWRATARLKRFFSADVRDAVASADHTHALHAVLSGIENVQDGLARAQQVEAAIFLPQCLLASQGDRVAMAHAVEGRFPFLDHRVVEFCNRLPSRLKLNGLTEKFLLKQVAADLVPQAIRRRPKQPYRAPITATFLGREGGHSPAYVEELLSPTSLKRTGYFNPSAVESLLAKGRRRGGLSEFESMALCGIISVQLLHQLFLVTPESSARRGRAYAERPTPHELAVAV